ncbi:MAG: hypothetical protein F2851_02960 [Actinobacteria bacterium]|uniref:Unannotated protein n=1 Tax=freshwater metagenome TaxID=449393 RepID=A0A6J5Z6W9_9ZZZZ|nr:hypothetical protein [Actinomycetota bacterium]
MTDDQYHDDPIEELPKRKLRNNLLTPAALILGSVLFFQSTLAGNISLSSGTGIEFGQGVSQTVACSGSNNLTLTPYSNFVNASGGGGTHYFNSLTVSGIPSSCDGAQFQINAYGNSNASPLALYNTTSTDVIVADVASTFRLDIRASGITLTNNSSSSFTVTFDTPVAASTSVFKLTMQSTTNSARTTYTLGNTGPGGGMIFYYSETGFNCGPAHSATGSPSGGLCNYLEVAPRTWSSATDPLRAWSNASDYNYDIAGVTVQSSGFYTTAGVGLGYKDSLAIVSNGRGIDSATAAAALAREYRGGSKSDWYLGSPAELNLLCQWARGVASNVTTECIGGTLNSPVYGADTAGIRADFYWASTQATPPSYAFTFHFNPSSTVTRSRQKFTDNYVRPIRAF